MGEDVTVSAIPTNYKGYLCRSRLEARWCIFFDTIGVAFDYEPKGYLLSDGTNYLPDFYLPQISMFAEVKPTNSGFDKAQQFAEEYEQEVLCLDGYPEFRTYTWLRQFEPSVIAPTDTHLDIYDGSRYYFDEHRLYSDADPSFYPSAREFSEKYREAVYKAKQFRFDVCTAAGGR